MWEQWRTAPLPGVVSGLWEQNRICYCVTTVICPLHTCEAKHLYCFREDSPETISRVRKVVSTNCFTIVINASKSKGEQYFFFSQWGAPFTYPFWWHLDRPPLYPFYEFYWPGKILPDQTTNLKYLCWGLVGHKNKAQLLSTSALGCLPWWNLNAITATVIVTRTAAGRMRASTTAYIGSELADGGVSSSLPMPFAGYQWMHIGQHKHMQL